MSTGPTPVTVVTEDELSERVARAIVAQTATHLYVVRVLRRGGYGYVKRIAPGLNRAAKGAAYFALVDLDQGSCAPDLVTCWLENRPPHPNFVLRVAVREVDAWLFADRDAFASFLGVAHLKKRIPTLTEAIQDPKQLLVSLCRHSRERRIRSGLLPEKGSTAQQGPGYNEILGAFVEHHWQVGRARPHSKSLSSAVARIREFRYSPPARTGMGPPALDVGAILARRGR